MAKIELICEYCDHKMYYDNHYEYNRVPEKCSSCGDSNLKERVLGSGDQYGYEIFDRNDAYIRRRSKK